MRSRDKEKQASIALSDAAIDWLVRLNSGEATDEDHAAFQAWRSTSPEHELAAQEADAIWHGIGVVGGPVRDQQSERERSKLTRRVVLGAGCLAVTGVAARQSGLLGPRLLADYTTGIGERRTVTLPDGSSVLLNAASALSFTFTETRRSLVLHEGQAIFSVMHDPARPFVVEAAGARARAVGTVFDVDIRPEEVVVTVVEGTVAVTADAAPEAQIIADAGHRVRYAGGAPFAAEAVDSALETAWRRGKLIFDRRPLGDVVAEIRRYRGGQIMIANAQIRALAVTGVFDLADPEAILRTIEETLPVRVTRLPLVTIIR